MDDDYQREQQMAAKDAALETVMTTPSSTWEKGTSHDWFAAAEFWRGQAQWFNLLGLADMAKAAWAASLRCENRAKELLEQEARDVR